MQTIFDARPRPCLGLCMSGGRRMRRCGYLLELWEMREFDALSFEFCPACGVHAPWVNACRRKEE